MRKIKLILTLIIIFISINSFSQAKSKTVYFEVYYEKDYPIAGGNIVERETKKINETTTDFNGKAQLIVTDFNSEFELSYNGPHVRIQNPKKTEKIMINIEKRKIEYYKNNKIFKRKKIKLIGY